MFAIFECNHKQLKLNLSYACVIKSKDHTGCNYNEIQKKKKNMYTGGGGDGATVTSSQYGNY